MFKVVICKSLSRHFMYAGVGESCREGTLGMGRTEITWNRLKKAYWRQGTLDMRRAERLPAKTSIKSERKFRGEYTGMDRAKVTWREAGN